MPTDNDSRDKFAALSKKLDKIEIVATHILATQPNNSDALNGLGLVKFQKENFEDAIALFEKARVIDPDRDDFIDNLIDALEASARKLVYLGKFSASIKLLRQAVEIRPDDKILSCRMAFVLCLEDRHKEGLVIVNKVLETNLKSATAHDVRGLALIGLGMIDDALVSFGEALDCDPSCASAYSNSGIAYRAKGEPKTAIKYFTEAIRLDSKNALFYNNLGVSLLDNNDLPQAEVALNKALSIEPDYAEAHFNLSRVLLMAENFRMGWHHNEWRWRCHNFPSKWRFFPQPTWQGQNIKNKKILVWSEQGIGDEIMFANTLPELVNNSAQVMIECSNRLVPIFSRSFNNVLVFARQDPPNLEIQSINPDFQIPIGSICNFYRKTAGNFPSGRNGYLESDPVLTAEIKARYASLGEGMKVGISWRSGNPIVGHERSIPLIFWDEIFALEGCQFVNLQYGEVDEDLLGVVSRTGVSVYKDDAVDSLNSAEDWFAQISALDFVISVDNSTIQVSGSLGIPTWLLLSKVPEWRFGLERQDNLWHPSIRVFRQQEKGEWEPLMKELAINFSAYLGKATSLPN